jgi:metallo-beta-lactamase family protein
MTMRLTVLGAAGEVTGSNYLIECAGSRILVDCGIFQGRDDEKRNEAPFTFVPSTLNAVLLTHAHLDHSGRIPLLVKQGFSGTIHATLPTLELLGVLWRDSANLMKEEADWRSRKNERKGLPPVGPLYSFEDAENALSHLRPASYDDRIDVAPGIAVRFRDAGHILGSAILEIWLTEGDDRVTIVFSGDLGPQSTVMERNPAIITEADYVVLESTYGNRLHKSNLESRDEFRSVMKDALAANAKVIIPTFVVDRAQRILYEIMLMQREGIVRDVPVFFDSPMGVAATGIYRKHTNVMSAEILSWTAKGIDPFMPDNLKYVSDVRESQAINDVKNAVVLAGSGMCTGGRVVHHLKHGAWDPNNHVVFVGYQAKGTLGRRLVDGEKELRIAGEDVTVKAKLHTINGFSAHGDRNDLMVWATNFVPSPGEGAEGPVFIVTHGEPEASESLAQGIREIGRPAIVPAPGQEILLSSRRDEAEREILRAMPAVCERESVECLLAEISALASGMRSRVAYDRRYEDVLPLLQSTRTLLETAEGHMAGGETPGT